MLYRLAEPDYIQVPGDYVHVQVEDGLSGSRADIDPDVEAVGLFAPLDLEAGDVYGSHQCRPLLIRCVEPILDVTLRDQ